MTPAVLFVGNFLSSSIKHRHYCEDLTDRLELRGWRLVRTSAHMGRARRMLDMLHVTWARRSSYDLAHVDVFSGPAFTWAELVCAELRSLSKPFVLTLRGGNLPAFARQSPRRTRRLFASAARVTAPSRYLRETMLEYRPDIVVLPNAVDVAHELGARDRIGARMIWVRSFHAIYNPVMAIDVLERVARSVPDATLTMVGHDKGDGSLAAVQQRAHALGVTDRLQIVGGVPKRQIPSLLAKADVFLNTADIDNTPVSVVEAMAAGLCVVSTSVGGIPYLLTNGGDAVLVPARAPDAMAAAVVRLCNEEDVALRMSRTARSHAAAWDWRPVLDQWERLLHEVRARV
ncbi:MAG: glycosyltransferase family 4 protein [Kofleriaceae bacterium]|nr:glycosyltransferase family 4 protein [Kofleriaceae bacterium]